MENQTTSRVCNKKVVSLCRPKIYIKQFKSELGKLTHHMDATSYHPVKKTKEDIQKEMNLQDDEAADLEQVCSVKNLQCIREREIISWEDINMCPDDLGLKVLEQRKQIMNKRHLKVKRKRASLLRSKYSELDCALYKKFSETKETSVSDRIAFPECLITVRVSYPRSVRRYKSVHHDYMCIGSQSLTELRDKICCPIDAQPISHYGADGRVEKKKMNQVITSALFFIEDTFYNDMRRDSSIDLSKVMVDWAKANDIVLGEGDLSAKSMSETNFEDLSIKLGKSYTFLHQGDCEHEVTFVDLGLLDSNHCQSRAAYPFPVTRPKVKGVPCKACHYLMAVWMVKHDELSDEDPSFYCKRCFELLHFNSKGQQICTFEARSFVNIPGLIPPSSEK